MPVPRIIGICGNGRVGKDTMAMVLAAQRRFFRVALADPMKRFCAEVFRFTEEQLWGNARDLQDPRLGKLTPRFALQTLGTEWGRNCHPDVWVNYGIHVARTLLDGYATYHNTIGVIRHEKDVGEIGGVVFSDLRFKNEILAMRKSGAILVRVYRPGFDGTDLGGVASHASEEEQRGIPDSDFDCVIHNDGTLPEYTEAVSRFLALLDAGGFNEPPREPTILMAAR